MNKHHPFYPQLQEEIELDFKKINRLLRFPILLKV